MLSTSTLERLLSLPESLDFQRFLNVGGQHLHSSVASSGVSTSSRFSVDNFVSYGMDTSTPSLPLHKPTSLLWCADHPTTSENGQSYQSIACQNVLPCGFSSLGSSASTNEDFLRYRNADFARRNNRINTSPGTLHNLSTQNPQYNSLLRVLTGSPCSIPSTSPEMHPSPTIPSVLPIIRTPNLAQLLKDETSGTHSFPQPTFCISHRINPSELGLLQSPVSPRSDQETSLTTAIKARVLNETDDESTSETLSNSDTNTLFSQRTPEWCITQLSPKKLAYTWTIENFSMAASAPGEILVSGCLPINVNDSYVWALHVAPYGKCSELRNYVSLRLVIDLRHPDGRAAVAKEATGHSKVTGISRLSPRNSFDNGAQDPEGRTAVGDNVIGSCPLVPVRFRCSVLDADGEAVFTSDTEKYHLIGPKMGLGFGRFFERSRLYPAAAPPSQGVSGHNGSDVSDPRHATVQGKPQPPFSSTPSGAAGSTPTSSLVGPGDRVTFYAEVFWIEETVHTSADYIQTTPAPTPSLNQQRIPSHDGARLPPLPKESRKRANCSTSGEPCLQSSSRHAKASRLVLSIDAGDELTLTAPESPAVMEAELASLLSSGRLADLDILVDSTAVTDGSGAPQLGITSSGISSNFAAKIASSGNVTSAGLAEVTLPRVAALQCVCPACAQLEMLEDHNSPSKLTIPAHRAILAACSPVLAKFLAESNSSKPGREVLAFRGSGVTANAVRALLNYAYTRNITSSAPTSRSFRLSHNDLFCLLRLSNRLGLGHLVTMCEARLRTELTGDTACNIFMAADELRANVLRDQALCWILDHAACVFDTKGYNVMSASRPLLVAELFCRLAFQRSSVGTEDQRGRPCASGSQRQRTLTWLDATTTPDVSEGHSASRSVSTIGPCASFATVGRSLH